MHTHHAQRFSGVVFHSHTWTSRAIGSGTGCMGMCRCVDKQWVIYTPDLGVMVTGPGVRDALCQHEGFWLKSLFYSVKFLKISHEETFREVFQSLGERVTVNINLVNRFCWAIQYLHLFFFNQLLSFILFSTVWYQILDHLISQFVVITHHLLP